MINLKQITKIDDYYHEFRKLSLQAPGISLGEQLSWFIKNMKQGIRTHVLLQECTKIEEAYNKALLYETYTSESGKQVYLNVQHQNDSTTQNTRKEQYKDAICCKCQTKGHIGENCQRHLLCTICGKTGHLQEICFKNEICSKCNVKGHIAKYCKQTHYCSACQLSEVDCSCSESENTDDSN
jgi:hypothetical protein